MARPSKAAHIDRLLVPEQNRRAKPSSIVVPNDFHVQPGSVVPQPTTANKNIRAVKKKRHHQRGRCAKRNKQTNEMMMADDLIDDETLATNLQQLNGQINETFCEPDGGAVGEHREVGSETIAESFMQLSGQTHEDCREPVGGARRGTFADRLVQISRCPLRPRGADEEERTSNSHVPPVFSPPESLSDAAYDRVLQKQNNFFHQLFNSYVSLPEGIPCYTQKNDKMGKSWLTRYRGRLCLRAWLGLPGKPSTNR